ncbi:hypothetical protein C7B77_14760 [Chamaesiphon polymorphus CCALA 037]|uniref:Uncharacterized protein n=1 Tax=Chamaesiphon polymorphus CCALA 037 TaxID=2107692 RepID=A0A2T1GDM3_9CYAN|nr:hypothetical protein C7B77_14760 [Chamaesiphon polymorphus CCALA 037]
MDFGLTITPGVGWVEHRETQHSINCNWECWVFLSCTLGCGCWVSLCSTQPTIDRFIDSF